MKTKRIGWFLATGLLAFLPSIEAQEDESVDLVALADQLQSTVERLRGLEFKTDVQKGVKTKAELIDFLESQIEKEFGDGKLERLSRFYQKVGFFPEGLDFQKVMMNLLEEQVGGFYDPESESLYLMKEFTGNESVMKILMVHEMTHALDDQYHDLAAMVNQEDANDDALFGRGAIVEGNATWVMNRYTLSGELDPSDLLAAAQSEMMRMDAVAAAPLILVRGLLDRYTHGERFIRDVLAKGDVDSVDELFESPPVSSEQIYHPAKYLRERDLPVSIRLGDFRTALVEGWTQLEENTFGEFGVAVLFQEFGRDRTRTDSAAIMSALSGSPTNLWAVGWDGDRASGWYNETTGKTVFFWMLAWDTEDDASEFLRGYRNRIFAKKYESPQIMEEIEGGFLLATDSAGDGVILEKRGNRTFVAEGLPFGLVGKLRETAWNSEFLEGSVPPVTKDEDRGPKKIAAAPRDGVATPDSLLDSANQFRDEASNFELSLPGTGWEFVTLNEPQVKVCAQRVDVSVRATVLVVPLDGQANLEAAATHTIDTLRNRLNGLEVVTNEAFELAGQTAHHLVATVMDDASKSAVTIETYFVQAGERFYTLTLRYPTGDEDAAAIGDTISSSFRLIEKP